MDEVNPSILESPAIVPHPKQTTTFPNFSKDQTFPEKIKKKELKKTKQESPNENAISRRSNR